MEFLDFRNVEREEKKKKNMRKTKTSSHKYLYQKSILHLGYNNSNNFYRSPFTRTLYKDSEVTAATRARRTTTDEALLLLAALGLPVAAGPTLTLAPLGLELTLATVAEAEAGREEDTTADWFMGIELGCSAALSMVGKRMLSWYGCRSFIHEATGL